MGIDRGDAQKRLAFVIMLNNDSMLPRYRRGAFLYIDPSRLPEIGDEVYVEVDRPALALIGILLYRRAAKICVKPYAAAAHHFPATTRVSRVVPPEEFLL
jgi:hypothetical protein